MDDTASATASTSWHRLVPSAITCTGAGLSFAGLVAHLPLLLLMGLACDLLDGYCARRLDAVTSFGAKLDWGVDRVVVIAALPLVFGTLPMLLVGACACVLAWEISPHALHRLSFRTVISLYLTCMWWFPNLVPAGALR